MARHGQLGLAVVTVLLVLGAGNKFVLAYTEDIVAEIEVGGLISSDRNLVREKRQTGGGMMDMAQDWLSTAGDWMSQAGEYIEPASQIAGTAMQIYGIFQQRDQMKQQQKLAEMQMNFQVESLCDQICVSAWSTWTTCTARCGGGTKQRSRKHILPGRCASLSNFECRLPTEQTTACNIGCANNRYPLQEGGGCDCGKRFSGECCDNDVTCKYLGKPEHGKVEGPIPGKYGDVATFTCEAGFAMDGTDQVWCGEGGKWNDEKPKCQRITCGTPPEPKDGYLLNSLAGTGQRYLFNDEALFACNEGYKLTGPTARRCMAFEKHEGRWSGFTPLCRPVNCGDPDFPLNGDRNGTDFYLGGKVTYSCYTGFRLMGSKERTCLPTGTWSGNPPKCELRTCEEPYIPKHGSMLRKREVYRYGIEVEFECEVGYNMVGGSRMRCVEDEEGSYLGTGGKWNAEPPVCEAAICTEVSDPENGAKDGSIYYYPYNVTFTCFAGYVLRGLPKIQCQNDGTWSGPVPTCEGCPLNFYKDSPDSLAECSPCPPHTHTVTTASSNLRQCVCDKGYKGAPGGPCQEIRCKELTAPAHGTKSDCGNRLGDECDFSCDNGFILERGSSRRMCQETEEWSGRDAVCGECPKDTFKSDMRSCLPCPRHSHTQGTGNMQEGCVCDEGYDGDKGGPCNDTNECETNGGKGPCSDVCENMDGTYRCDCLIPGYKIDPLNKNICIVDKTCRNLTVDDAPENGGLVCHWYREENSQQCGVRCNPGYEFPSRVNNYEYCGQTTGYLWSHEERDEVIEPCIEEFFPDFRLEANSTYFVRECKLLTEDEKDQVKREFAQMLTDEGICKKRDTQVCNMEDVGIICGRTFTRRKRDTVEQVEEIDFNFNIRAFQPEKNPKDCDKICEFLRIPKSRCPQLCMTTYKRFLRAAVSYSKQQLERMYANPAKARFQAARRDFHPTGDALKTSDVIVKCDPGMYSQEEICVPCGAGTYLDPTKNECELCPMGYFQPETQQETCLLCPVGMTSTKQGATICKVCPSGRYGLNCSQTCGNCVHGSCNPRNGKCDCDSGWEGKMCNIDIQSCTEDSCYPGVKCSDIPAPGTGYRCASCPQGLRGDGSVCTKGVTR